MSMINLFLRKVKVRESQHGIVMVVTAYVLSFAMLIVGSDVFYTINSAAAGINTDTVEEAKELTTEGNLNPQNLNLQTVSLKETAAKNSSGTETNTESTSAISEPATYEIFEGETLAKTIIADGDTVWLMSHDLTEEEYNNRLKQVRELESAAEDAKIAYAAKEESASATEIESLSVEEEITTIIDLTADEVQMLERIVQAEAGGEDMIGKILIANVIFNRIASEDFPDNVEDVIFQQKHGDYQFSPVSNDSYWSVSISEDTEEAVMRALEGEDYSEGALYFMARKRTSASNAQWFDRNLLWLFKHGGHEFYK
ncbi:MAG: cell wall hydrolase [Mobilitalea sp.]